MAMLHVKAETSAGVMNYTIGIDGTPVLLDGNGEGDIPVQGGCGDESQHTLAFDFQGGAGDTLTATVTCDEREVCLLEAEITGESEPFGAGTQDFLL